MSGASCRLWGWRFATLVLAVVAMWGIAGAVEPERIGQVKILTGEATVLRSGERSPLKVGDPLQQGDVVETGPSASLGITFTDATTFALGPSTSIALDEFRFDSATLKGNLLAGMSRGTLSVAAGEMTKVSPDAMKIRTPRAILGIRGTDFLVRVEEAGKKSDTKPGKKGAS